MVMDKKNLFSQYFFLEEGIKDLSNFEQTIFFKYFLQISQLELLILTPNKLIINFPPA
jgi:hypothetical protein